MSLFHPYILVLLLLTALSNAVTSTAARGEPRVTNFSGP
ncbi:hypothetical protein UCMB321_4102 [Pseudomonas batumici]|uniref:Uncharacterized protein n=1 Tax=Pseudomonas batumici TaxID=226910 RepID=A0A0C2HY96_9PSED|nr:hypothetical protein UCMB321_4102 [Pseudomonas batumici]